MRVSRSMVLDPYFWFSWSQQFLSLGGYSALLTRLNEILEVEWRFAGLIRRYLLSAKYDTF